MKPLICLLAAVFPLAAFAQGQAPTTAAPVANPSDLSQYTTADALWLHIQEVKKGPKTAPTSQAEAQMVLANMVEQIYVATGEFVTRYPDDPRKWDARLLQIQTGTAINRISGHPDGEAVTAQYQQLANETDAPSLIRAQARYQLLGLAISEYVRGNPSVTSASIVEQLHQFTADFPTYPSLDVLKYKVAETINPSDPATAEALLKELADAGEGRVADQARKELNTKERLKSPLDLHFTAVDGSQVDLSTMRGKVVLVDFWATWCAPCRQEAPNVVAAYNKLHDQGFEVVGISLDQDRNSLLKFTAENGMTWPQYFDGKGWDNSISTSFAIEEVPTMWLVNKKGYVVTTNGRTDLEGQVEKLLAEGKD